jgi:hypothetical protein
MFHIFCILQQEDVCHPYYSFTKSPVRYFYPLHFLPRVLPNAFVSFLKCSTPGVLHVPHKGHCAAGPFISLDIFLLIYYLVHCPVRCGSLSGGRGT